MSNNYVFYVRLAFDMLQWSTQPQNTFWTSGCSAVSAENNPPIDAQQTNFHSLLPSLHWTDYVSSLFSLWKWRGDRWTFASWPKWAAECQCYFGDSIDISDVFQDIDVPSSYRHCLTDGLVSSWQKQRQQQRSSVGFLLLPMITLQRWWSCLLASYSSLYAARWYLFIAMLLHKSWYWTDCMTPVQIRLISRFGISWNALNYGKGQRSPFVNKRNSCEIARAEIFSSLVFLTFLFGKNV